MWNVTFLYFLSCLSFGVSLGKSNPNKMFFLFLGIFFALIGIGALIEKCIEILKGIRSDLRDR